MWAFLCCLSFELFDSYLCYSYEFDLYLIIVFLWNTSYCLFIGCCNTFIINVIVIMIWSYATWLLDALFLYILSCRYQYDRERSVPPFSRWTCGTCILSVWCNESLIWCNVTRTEHGCLPSADLAGRSTWTRLTEQRGHLWDPHCSRLLHRSAFPLCHMFGPWRSGRTDSVSAVPPTRV